MSTRAPTQGPIQLTSADAGATVPVARGQAVEVTLFDPGMQWGPVKDNPTGLLRPDPAPAPPDHGQLAIWTAVAPGTVKVEAVGMAFCNPALACPMYARLFEVTLVIY